MRRQKNSAATSIADSASASQRALSATKLRARSSVLASSTARPARSGTFATCPPATPTVTVPSTSPRRIGPSTSCGARTETLDPLAPPHADLDRPRRAQRQGAVLVADVGPGEDLAGADRMPLAVEREAVVEQTLRFEVAAGLGPDPEHGGDQLDALALAGADQDVVGGEGVPGLDPVRPRHLEQEVVDRFDPSRRVEAVEERRPGVGDLREGRDFEQPAAEGGEVVGARVVALLVEPDRVRVVGVGEAQGRRVAVHLVDEAGVGAGRRERQVVGGVVAAAQDQPVEEVADADPLAGPQFEQRLAVDRVVGRGPNDLVERQVVQRHVGGHHLRRAGDREAAVRRVRGEHGAGAGIDQRPGAGGDLRRALAGGGRRARHRQHQRRREGGADQAAGRHQQST